MMDTHDPVLVVNATALKYLGEWHRLVSSTNWEKGRIVSRWKQAMVSAGAGPREASDEVWAVQVGQVSAQHVGRLRRAWERFGSNHRTFPGLYWSHFAAVLEWEDGEEWLRKACDERFSVAQMKHARWESMGRPGAGPEAADAPATLADEEADQRLREDQPPVFHSGEMWDVLQDDEREAAASPRRATDEDTVVGRNSQGDTIVEHHPEAVETPLPTVPTVAAVRPFENLPELPADFTEAFEAFKLAIVRQRLAAWSAVPRDHVLTALESLVVLVRAPLDQDA